MRLSTAWLAALALHGGCASSVPVGGDARAVDARVPDATLAPVDAGVDAAPPPRPGAEIVSAGGRVQRGTLTMDVTVGHPLDQTATTSEGRQLTGATVVFP